MTRTKTTEDAIDPAGEDTVLHYVGPDVVGGIPARDLHGNDLARAAYVRAHRAIDWDHRDKRGNGPALPEPATQDELAALVDELVDSGAYAFAEGQKVPRGKKPVEQPADADDTSHETTETTTTDEPAAPAEG